MDKRMRKDIVIVDDHQLFLNGISALLSKYKDVRIIKATTSVKDALQVIEQTAPHLVISDISMPEMSGIEFIAILKKKYPDIKIMVLSMFASLQSYKDIDAYLLKESSEKELIKAIRNVVEKNQKYLRIKENKTETIQFTNNCFLTKKEKNIATLIVKGHTSVNIANDLGISTNTVLSHRKNIFTKLNVHNIAGLTIKLIHLGII